MSCRRALHRWLLATVVAFGAAGSAVAGADPTAVSVPNGRVDRVPPADALIRPIGDPAWLGDDLHRAGGAEQTISRSVTRIGRLVALVRIDNETDSAADVIVRGSRTSRDLAVRYTRRGRDVTRLVTAGRLVIRDLAPGASTYLRVGVRTRRALQPGAVRAVRVTARSGAPGTGDTVRAALERPSITADQSAAADLVNATRATIGRAALPIDAALSERAQTWADHMAATGRVESSGLFWGLPAHWRSVAEVVGAGSTLAEAHAALAADRGEHLKMVSDWTMLGTGVATRGGRVYVTYVFLLV